ncbi:MAG: hypothetical protein Ta2G_00870 [Termitinemataceae bacterium]|nr:MAG: hypothetical protein Ta2G_00870 [Termitinemataceae bacterium]
MEKEKDWKEKVPLLHYSGIYKTLTSAEIAARCNIIFDEAAKCFEICMMGIEYTIAFPVFEMKKKSTANDDSILITDSATKVLMLRFLCEGKWTPATGKQLSYREIPWGEVYFKNFEGRCIRRVERTFGSDLKAFSKIFDVHKNLKSEKLAGKEYGFRFEFLSGLYMSIIIWEGDEDFPSSAQILFDDNFPAAFSAEDIAFVGDIAIGKLKELSSN